MPMRPLPRVLDRRRACAWGLGLVATAAVARRARGAERRILAAPSTSSVLVARAVDDDPAIAFDLWRNPDQLRAAVVGARADAVTLPVNVAANLHNRGLPVRLVNILAAGPMTVVTREPGIAGPDDLRGRRLRLYFKDDMPDVALRWLLSRYGLQPGVDVALDYAGSAVETSQLLLAGVAESALLNEPAASTVLLEAAAANAPLRRAFTLQDAWAEVTGKDSPLPMAGLAAVGALDAGDRAFVRALHERTVAAADWVRAHPEAAGDLAARRLGFRADATTAALAAARVRVDAAATVRPTIERFLGALGELSPALIGGRLPDGDLYLAF